MRTCKACQYCDWYGKTIDFAMPLKSFYCLKIKSAWDIITYAHIFPAVCKYWEVKNEKQNLRYQNNEG